SCSADHHHLPSFPTRRSSDLCDTALREAFPRQRASRDSIRDSGNAHADGTALYLRVIGETRSRADNPLAKFAFDRKQRQISREGDRKSTRLNSSHLVISYAVF